VYEAGPLVEQTSAEVRRVLGLNAVAHVEVLNAIIRLNAERGFDSGNTLTYLELGSSQGLHIRANRALYAPSKAIGLDFCSAVAAGGETARTIYFAPGPTDTPMLHRNHWSRAGGTAAVHTVLLQRDPELYRRFFVECDGATVGDVAATAGVAEANLVGALPGYSNERREAFNGADGVLAPVDCGTAIATLTKDGERFPSGCYLMTAPNGRPLLRFCGFDALDRRGLFEERCRAVALES